MGALLRGACDDVAAVRHSCLACLADAAATLRFGLHPWATQLLQLVESALEGETDAQSRAAACYLLGLLLQSLGASALATLPAEQLAALYRRLKLLRDRDTQHDAALLPHVDAALEQMRMLGRALVRGNIDEQLPSPGQQPPGLAGTVRGLDVDAGVGGTETVVHGLSRLSVRLPGVTEIG